MCGICGILAPLEFAEKRDLVASMCSVMHHRGPDDDGFYADEHISLGMRRLSIIDLLTGKQPISNEDGSVVIVFNGEIYNYRTLKQELERQGHSFVSNSDTEVIVHLYEELKERCVDRLRGMFVFAVWDKKERKLFIARDRLGIKPLYYAIAGDKFLFASELKALLSTGLIERRVDFQALHHYLSFYAVPAPYTMIEGVSALPAGHAIVLKNGKHQVHQYWDVSFDRHPQVQAMDEQEIKQQLRVLLTDAVRMRLMSDVPLGAFLSGGIDSSTVVGLMSQIVSEPVKTFSIGFGKEGQRIDELGYARSTAEHFGTDHTEFIIGGQDVLDNLEHFIYSLDQPSGDGLNTYFVSKITRTGVTVALSGLGGDELFAGYSRFRMLCAIPRYEGVARRLPQALQAAARNASMLIPPRFGLRLPFRPVTYLGLAAGDFADRFAWSGRVLYSEREKSRLYERAILEKLSGLERSGEYLERYIVEDERDVVSKVSRLELKGYMANTLLRDTDMMSMAHSLEIRVPLIDHELVDFIASIPPSYKLKGDVTKYILVEAVKDLLPPEIVGREKRGFELPMWAWMQNELKPVVEDVFSEQSIRNRGLFDHKEMQRLRRSSWISGLYMRIWALVVLELWMRRYIDQPLLG